MSESLVDLLLVRLGREEEKRKVLKLLVTSLDLSVSDAEEAVNNSPSVIREAVPMGEARIIQKDLYPYIDLLPRFNDDDDVDGDSEPADDEDEENYEETAEEEEADEEEAAEETEEETAEEAEEGTDEEEEEEKNVSDSFEPIVITTASDEIISTTRCHICGRTPTDGEKLAPCRTCSDLTCRDCFDRLAHVCNKCAASGKSIERVNEGVEPEKEHGLVFDSEIDDVPEVSSKSSTVRYILGGLLFLIALAAAFYFMDPMELFGDNTEDTVEQNSSLADTTASIPADSLNEVSTDTTLTTPDSLESIDTQLIGEDPLRIRSLPLGSEYSAIENPPPVVFRTQLPSSVDGTVLEEESEILSGQLSVIAAWIPVELDDAVLIQFHDTTEVLFIVLNHPEETEVRLDLLRRTAQWLAPSEIDQLVLLYRENRYQNTMIMSLVSSNFTQVQGILSPSLFQEYLGYREDCWEAVSGPVSEWLTDIQ